MVSLPALLLLAPLSVTQDSALTLHAAAARALEVHPLTQAAAATLAGATASRREARAAWFPQLTTQGSITRFQEPMVVTPIHALDATQFAFDRTLVQGDVRLSWTVFDGGGRSARIRAATAAMGARTAGGDVAEADVLVDVARRYLIARTAGAILAAQEEGLAALTTERDRVRRLVTEGAVARVELLRVEAALAGVVADVVEARANEDVAVRALARTLELPAVAPAALVELRPAQRDMPSREHLLPAVEERSPDLAEALAAVEEARQVRRGAQAQWFPRVDLQGAAIAYGDGDWRFSPEWQVGARIFYPVLLGGQRSAAVARAGAQVDVADARLRQVHRDLAERLDRAIAARTEADARVRALEAVSTHLGEVARIEALALEAGAGVQAEYLRAEADARRARAELARGRATRVLADIELARVTGELSLTWLADNVESVS
ncbi:MAG: TolC family protein [Gemmatimonadota bacterium]|nr:TolC family protein [Gemmatimonadota bacterium]MDH4350296.1 TolC family protein [Gemmatimonadota bacterium]MDH5198541.1 TolC family protein [Gemmatimonadota bacterium]